MFGFFKKKKQSKIEMLIEKDGIENVAKSFSNAILLELPTREIAYQFILEEIEASSKGNDEALSFATNSGISPHKYKGSMNNSRPEVDGPLGPQQTILAISSQLTSNTNLMVEMRTKIVDNIMKHFSFGKYEDQQPTPLKGGMRLKDAEVDILFIVRNDTIIYINDEVDHLFEDSGRGVEKLDGRIANYILTDQSDGTVIEIFVAFDDSDSYTLFTLQTGTQERLNYVAQAIIDYFGKTGIYNMLSLDAEKFLFDITYAFKLYRKNGKYYMINNSHTQAYLIDKSTIMRDDIGEIQSIYNDWVNKDTGDTIKINYFNSKDMKFDDTPSDLLDYGLRHRDDDGNSVSGMTLHNVGEAQDLNLRIKPYLEKYGITTKTPEIEAELADLSSGFFQEETFLEFVKGFVRFIIGTRMDKKLTLTMMSFSDQNDIYAYNNEMNGDALYIYSCRQEAAQFELYIGADEEGTITELNYTHKLNRTVTNIPLDTQGFWYMFKNIFCDINGISSDDIVLSPETQKILATVFDSDTECDLQEDTIIIGDFMWEKNSRVMNWNDGIEYAKNLKLGGYDDWRLPTLEEMGAVSMDMAIAIEYERNFASFDSSWTSTTLKDDTSRASGVEFNTGRIMTYGHSKSGSHIVRCVRDR